MASLAIPPITNATPNLPSSTTSSNPIIKQQQELYFSKYNENMSTEQTNNLIERIIILQQLYFQDTIIQSQYNDIEYWESISDGLHVSNHTELNTADDDKNNNDATRTNQHRNKDNILSSISTINNQGYDVIELGEMNDNTNNKTNTTTTATAINITAKTTGNSNQQIYEQIQNTIANLKQEGFPPSFIFIYDEIWYNIIINMFDIYALLLDDENVYMESDLNCWSLRRPPITTTPTTLSDNNNNNNNTTTTSNNYIGQSFNQSHRDMKYSNCHNIDTEAFTSLNCWIPLNPIGATSQNGCMNVVPIEHDDFFYDYTHIYHMQTNKTLQFMDDNNKELMKDNIDITPYNRELICKAGDICTWVPSLIHWGGQCKQECIEPRISIAMTFRKCNAKQSVYGSSNNDAKEPSSNNNDHTTKKDEDNEPQPIQQKDIYNLTISQRLGYIAKSIISYAHWYPGLPELTLERLKKGSSH